MSVDFNRRVVNGITEIRVGTVWVKVVGGPERSFGYRNDQTAFIPITSKRSLSFLNEIKRQFPPPTPIDTDAPLFAEGAA